jgi:BirA family transcriptional regulator, biotin operon repressor / biotin---[acetyl-CoA-carboxylase] ligase
MNTPAAPAPARLDVPPLSARAIESWLVDSGAAAGCVVETVEFTGSTNEDLIGRARAEQPAVPVLRAADYQYGGRGRQGRQWLALPRDAVLMSLAIPLVDLPPSLPAVTLACGCALADVLRERGVDVRLKWPNDLHLQRRKLAGILSELAVDGEARYTLVVGIGLNLHLEDEAKETLDHTAAALDEVLAGPVIAAEREAWIGRFGAATLAAVDRFTREGFAPFMPRYNELLEARGELVDAVDGTRRVASGKLLEVDGAGRLVIETASGPRLVSVGDVSLRAATE